LVSIRRALSARIGADGQFDFSRFTARCLHRKGSDEYLKFMEAQLRQFGLSKEMVKHNLLSVQRQSNFHKIKILNLSVKITSGHSFLYAI